MGQACGPKETGAWGTTEWMPIMTKSCVALGCLPAMSGVRRILSLDLDSFSLAYQPVAWIPLDAIGQAYVDWVLNKDDLPVLVNVVHPRPTNWDVILRGLRQELGDSLPIVPMEEWVGRLEKLAKDPVPDDLTRVVSLCTFQWYLYLMPFRVIQPALKIMDFFRSIAHPTQKNGEVDAAGGTKSAMNLAYETSELLRSSPVMRELQPMSEEHARAWVRYWKAKGFVA